MTSLLFIGTPSVVPATLIVPCRTPCNLGHKVNAECERGTAGVWSVQRGP